MVNCGEGIVLSANLRHGQGIGSLFVLERVFSHLSLLSVTDLWVSWIDL